MEEYRAMKEMPLEALAAKEEALADKEERISELESELNRSKRREESGAQAEQLLSEMLESGALIR